MHALRVLRVVTFAEGTSYLLLVAVFMPLKYIFGMPLFVRIGGSIHGLLFLSFLLALYQAVVDEQCTAKQAAKWLLVSLIPGSLFWLDSQFKQLERQS
jgi:integral membrane protein